MGYVFPNRNVAVSWRFLFIFRIVSSIIEFVFHSDAVVDCLGGDDELQCGTRSFLDDTLGSNITDSELSATDSTIDGETEDGNVEPTTDNTIQGDDAENENKQTTTALPMQNDEASIEGEEKNEPVEDVVDVNGKTGFFDNPQTEIELPEEPDSPDLPTEPSLPDVEEPSEIPIPELPELPETSKNFCCESKLKKKNLKF